MSFVTPYPVNCFTRNPINNKCRSKQRSGAYSFHGPHND